MNVSINQTVYVAEYGHGARKATVQSVLPDGKLLVKFADGMPNRTVFPRSVFETAEAAEKDLLTM